MTTPHQPYLTQALQDLADVDAPLSVTDRALGTARGMRRRRHLAGVAGALALVAAVAAPLLLHSGAHGRSGFSQMPAASGPSTRFPTCAARPNPTAAGPTDAPVTTQQAPEYVRIATADLRLRDGFTVHTGYAECDASGGYAHVSTPIDLAGSAGHLVVGLDIHTDTSPSLAGAADTCATLGPLVNPTPTGGTGAGSPSTKVLFCTDATSTAPMVFGTLRDGITLVGAVYPGHRTVAVEWFPTAGHGGAVTVDAMRSVVTDPAMRNQLP